MIYFSEVFDMNVLWAAGPGKSRNENNRYGNLKIM